MNAAYICPAVTAFTRSGDLDLQAQKSVYDNLILGKIGGILILGSIGEFFSIPIDRKKALIREAIMHINKRAQVIVGTASMDVNEVVELSNYAYDQGADAVIIVSPYYFALSPSGIEEYYDYLAERCRGDIYLYNFPERTGYDLSPEIALNLVRKHRNIVGYKDTVTGMDHTRELIKLIKPEFPDFKIYSGYDNNFAQNVLAGGDGCIGGLSNLVPEICSAWVTAFLQDDLAGVAAIQQTIDKLMGIYSVGKPFIPYIKAAMNLRGIPIRAFSTFPMPVPAKQDVKKLRLIMEQANLLA